MQNTLNIGNWYLLPTNSSIPIIDKYTHPTHLKCSLWHNKTQMSSMIYSTTQAINSPRHRHKSNFYLSMYLQGECRVKLKNWGESLLIVCQTTSKSHARYMLSSFIWRTATQNETFRSTSQLIKDPDRNTTESLSLYFRGTIKNSSAFQSSEFALKPDISAPLPSTLPPVQPTCEIYEHCIQKYYIKIWNCDINLSVQEIHFVSVWELGVFIQSSESVDIVIVILM